MVSYRTLFGKEINLSLLPIDEHAMVQLIFVLAEANKDPSKFASRFRQLARKYLPKPQMYFRFLRGSVGDIFRDCYYRLCSETLDAEKKQEFLENITYNPLRLLYDRWLDGNWRYQSDFAEEAGLDSGAVTRAFKNVTENEGRGEVSMKALANAFKRLGIVPEIMSDPKVGEAESDHFSQLPSSPTCREWMSILLISSITRSLCKVMDKESQVKEIIACRDALAHYLGFMYGIRDWGGITDFVHRVLREILTVTKPTLNINRDDLLAMVANPDEVSFRLVMENLAMPVEMTSIHASQAKAVTVVFVLCADDLTPEEKDVADRLIGSQWASTIETVWAETETRVKKWSSSPLAEKAFAKFIADLN